MQDVSPLWIGMAVEIVAGIVVPVENDWPDIPVPGFVQILVFLPQQIISARILAILTAGVQVIGIGSEAFVEPGMLPAAQRDQVAPPLMCNLMGDNPFIGKILFRILICYSTFPQKSSRSGFSATAHIGRDYLIVFGPGIVIFIEFVEKIYHMGSLAKGPFGVLCMVMIDPVIDRQRSQRILDDLKIPDAEA